MLDTTQARRKTVIVRNDDARIEALEVEYDQRVRVEARQWLQYKRQILGRSHMSTLLNARRHGNDVLRLSNPNKKS